MAAALSNLLGFDSEKTELAIGISATQAGGLAASFGTMAKPLHPGKAAMDGLLSAALAEAGFTGPRDAINGDGGIVSTYLEEMPPMRFPASYRPGDEVLKIGIKPYPSCLLTHPSVDAAIQLASRLPGPLSDVAEIECRVNPLAARVAGRQSPKSGLEGKFSVQYCVAAALANSRLVDADFVDAQVGDPALAELCSRVRLVADDRLEAIGAVVEVTYNSGSSVAQQIPVAKGNPANPMTESECLAKFRDVAEPVVGEEGVNKLVDGCLRLEELVAIDFLV